jgi:hypothetical protein
MIMKNSYYRYIITILISVIVLCSFTAVSYASTQYQPSSWSAAKIKIAKTAGIMPEGFDSKLFTDNIMRRDFCEILMNTYRIYGYKLPDPLTDHPFTDTQDTVVEQAYVLGLISGTGNGLFSPEQPLTREMAAVMLFKLRMLFQYAESFDDDHDYSEYDPPVHEHQKDWILEEKISDSKKVSAWARSSIADVYSCGILVGTADNRINPGDSLTREQAVILVLCLLAYSDESCIRKAGVEECVLPAPSGVYISRSYNKGNILLDWNDIPSAAAYSVTIYKNDVPVYTANVSDSMVDLQAETTYTDQGTGTYSFSEEENRFFNTIFDESKQDVPVVLEVVPLNSDGKASVFSFRREFMVSPWFNENEMIYGSPWKYGFANAEEASLNVTNIKVKVWNLSSSGEKTTRTTSLSVNKNVAETVKNIFADIYNGPEKFPVKSCTAYSYRSGTSQHSAGVAIDINSEENYFIGWDGKIRAGRLWDSNTNPYSIPTDGDVVNAFKKYGWSWSPNMNWSNGADYMHFSLTGR